jgi:hypothetical protein
MIANRWPAALALLGLSLSLLSCQVFSAPPEPTATPTLTPRVTETAAPVPSATVTNTPTPTLIPTVTETAAPVPTSTAASSSTPTAPTSLSPTPTFTPGPTLSHAPFDGERAYQAVEKQVAFGPRTPGSQAHTQTVEWIQQELRNSGWAVEMQETTYREQPVRNIIAKRGDGKTPWVILGAHYDTRLQANRDPDPAKQEQPVPGANDGASGAAVLLELARVLPKDLDKQVWLVFFDSEDQGQLLGWDWIFGSRAFAESLQGTPDAVVIVDMVGDASLNLPREQNSDQGLVDEIWAAAAERGHEQFLPQPGYALLDDHTPFLEKGLRAADIIDFDFPYWHTSADTLDKVSAESLHAVGDTLLYWLVK